MHNEPQHSGRRAGTTPTADVPVRAGRDDAAVRECIADVEGFRELSDDWDRQGGIAAQEGPVRFAVKLLEKLSSHPEIPAPLVRPISGGVYLEWRSGERLLYFEVDEESVLRYSRSPRGEETAEDPGFDVERACRAVVDFHENDA